MKQRYDSVYLLSDDKSTHREVDWELEECACTPDVSESGTIVRHSLTFDEAKAHFTRIALATDGHGVTDETKKHFGLDP